MSMKVNPIGSNVYFECLTPEGGSFLPAVFINIFKSFYSLQRQIIDSVVERRLTLKPATRVHFLTVAIFVARFFHTNQMNLNSPFLC